MPHLLGTAANSPYLDRKKTSCLKGWHWREGKQSTISLHRKLIETQMELRNGRWNAEMEWHVGAPQNFLP